ncbi:NERD domain-containing protein [Virgibacillus necropolis]|uniref:nuclease-related domain-containing protein n=1 Tax=Virgibacillus necropolis TaxID=163877 RepID=UPI00384EDF7B
MLMLLNLFKKRKEVSNKKTINNSERDKKSNKEVAVRKGEIGEYKIDIQLSQLPKEHKYLSDLLIKNQRSISGYSQIDHLVITPYGIFVIETKNYQGTIYGGKNRKMWLVNGKFKMLSPLIQNYGHIEALKKYIDKKYYNYFNSIISFTKRCKLKVDLDLREISSSELVIYDFYLSESIHRKVSIAKLKYKEPFLSGYDILHIYNAFAKANITDPGIREKHNSSIEEVKSDKSNMKGDLNCVVCNQPISQKVATYCLTNKRFKGNLYCYEHQKTQR